MTDDSFWKEEVSLLPPSTSHFFKTPAALVCCVDVLPIKKDKKNILTLPSVKQQHLIKRCICFAAYFHLPLCKVQPKQIHISA